MAILSITTSGGSGEAFRPAMQVWINGDVETYVLDVPYASEQDAAKVAALVYEKSDSVMNKAVLALLKRHGFRKQS